MQHIIITAGGTSEPIDGVRRIGNTSTGSLSAHIYEAVSDYVREHPPAGGEPEYTVHYVVSATAVRPEPRENLPVRFYPVTDVASVLTVLERLTGTYQIGYVVHAMAVSDFTKGYLIGREALADELTAACMKVVERGGGDRPAHALRSAIAQVLEEPAGALAPQAKASSRDELMLSLVKTPKLIDRIRQWAPRAVLVGFKLLKGAEEAELVRVAAELAERSGCQMVLANDLLRIGENGHFGLLIKDGMAVERYETKREIAAGIARRMLGAECGHGEGSFV